MAVAEEEEIREEAGSVKVTPVWSQQDFLKVKVQKSSFDMLRTLQWTGCTRYIEAKKNLHWYVLGTCGYAPICENVSVQLLC